MLRYTEALEAIEALEVCLHLVVQHTQDSVMVIVALGCVDLLEVMILVLSDKLFSTIILAS